LPRICRTPRRRCAARRHAGQSTPACASLALVVGLQGRLAEAETIARAELPPEEAAANVAYLRQMLAHRGNAATPDHGAHAKTGAT
jgi:Flp pilus assembly protein TadD